MKHVTSVKDLILITLSVCKTCVCVQTEFLKQVAGVQHTVQIYVNHVTRISIFQGTQVNVLKEHQHLCTDMPILVQDVHQNVFAGWVT